MTKKAILKKNFYYKGDSNSMDVLCAGEELEYENKNNCYVIHHVAVEPTKFSQSFIEDNPEYFEIIKEYGRNWKPEYGEAFWFEEIDGNICYDTYTDNSEDNYIIQQHPIFSTKEEAKEWQKAKNTLYDLRDQINGDWVPDWEHGEVKYYLVFDWRFKEVTEHLLQVVELSHNLWFKENPRTYCQENGISWNEIKEAFKIFLRIK
jgi:hypothetical protein